MDSLLSCRVPAGHSCPPSLPRRLPQHRSALCRATHPDSAASTSSAGAKVDGQRSGASVPPQPAPSPVKVFLRALALALYRSSLPQVFGLDA